MKKLNKQWLAALFAVMFLSSFVTAQTNAFTYQGKLTDTSSNANGPYDFVFKLFDHIEDPSQVGDDIPHNDLPVSNGIFTAVLDFGATAFQGNGERFLEIHVRPGASTGTYAMLTPRQRVTSAPFAIRSVNSGSADSMTSSCVLCITNLQIQSIEGSKITGTVANALTASSSTIAQNVSGVVQIANGGTGSSTQSFVDLLTGQTVVGAKAFVNDFNSFTGIGAGITSINPANISTGTANISIGGMAANSATVSTGSTPSVGDLTMLALSYSSSTELTDLTDGVNGQCVLLLAVNNNVSILDTGIFRLSTNWTPIAEDTLTVCQSDAIGSPLWYERARSSNFSANFLLAVAKAGAGTGTVTSNIAGINCGADCSENYSDGTIVTLTAAPVSESFFGGWSGGGCTGTGTCQLTMNAARNVTAAFHPINASLTVTKIGSSTGTVTSNPAGIDCGADCQETYSFGTVVTLTATPAPNTAFAGWLGDCSGIFTCEVTMDNAKNVTAIFNAAFPLTVTKDGSGTGLVVSNFFGITCGDDCTENYSVGTVVTLQAFPLATSTFEGWSGGGCTGTGTCTVTMDMARTVNATFNNTTFFTLTVEKVIGGSTGGTVTSSPAGINCGADCSESYLGGTVVTLTAVPNAGSVFSAWTGTSGQCNDTGPCQVAMNQTKTVFAIFNSQAMSMQFGPMIGDPGRIARIKRAFLARKEVRSGFRGGNE